jgi:hypothetical protein
MLRVIVLSVPLSSLAGPSRYTLRIQGREIPETSARAMVGSIVESKDNETPRAPVPPLLAIVNNEQPVTKHGVELVEDGNIVLDADAPGGGGGRNTQARAAYPNTATGKFFWGGLGAPTRPTPWSMAVAIRKVCADAWRCRPGCRTQGKRPQGRYGVTTESLGRDRRRAPLLDGGSCPATRMRG